MAFRKDTKIKRIYRLHWIWLLAKKFLENSFGEVLKPKTIIPTYKPEMIRFVLETNLRSGKGLRVSLR